MAQLTTDGLGGGDLGRGVAFQRGPVRLEPRRTRSRTDGDILVARSANAGATWSTPAALNTNAASDADSRHCLAPAADDRRAGGNWVAVWDSDDSLGGAIETDGDILVARSADAGRDVAARPMALNTNAARRRCRATTSVPR